MKNLESVLDPRRLHFAVAFSALCAASLVRPAAGQVTTRVSLSSAGAQGDGWSSRLSISADCRYVAFTSQASNLVPGDTNGVDDVFVRDRLLAVTERVSVAKGERRGTTS